MLSSLAALPAVASEREGIAQTIGEMQAAIAYALAPPRRPILRSPPPRPKPERAPPGPAIETVAECGYATIVSRTMPGRQPVYRALFAPTMADAMAAEGCLAFQQGCNVCSIRYDGCSEAERKACKDAACLERKCERRVICSAKLCTVQGAAPTCEARIARTACLKRME